MRPSRFLLIYAAACIAGLAAHGADSSFSGIHVGYLFPAGGQLGQSVVVTVGGQSIGSTTGAIASGSGVRITVLDVYKSLSGKREAELRDIIGQYRASHHESFSRRSSSSSGKSPAAFKKAPSPAINLASTKPAPSPSAISGTSACLAPAAPAAASPSRIAASGTASCPSPVAASPSKLVASGIAASPALVAPTQPKLIVSATPAPTPTPTKPLPPLKIVINEDLPAANMTYLRADAEILRKCGISDDEIQHFVDRAARLGNPRRQVNQQLAQTVTLRIDIAPDAPVGPRDIRLVTAAGVTNPLTFCVGTLPEQTAGTTDGKTPDKPMQVNIPVVLNGQILPGEAHFFSFQARRGAHLVIATQARDLVPYFADTVPGWFQAAVALYDSKGNQVAYADHFRFSPDPILSYHVPASGTYRLEVRDTLYRGREDFVFRVTVGEIPFITDVFPLGGQFGAPALVQLSGWNLPVTRGTIRSPRSEGIAPLTFLWNGFSTTGPKFDFDTLPECIQQDAAGQIAEAQRVNLPIVINGWIEHPGDIEKFAFSCRAGEKIVAEVFARRLNSPLDSVLKILDSKGRQIAFNDDIEDKGEGLLTHCADSRVTFTAPANGLYYALLADTQHHGGLEYAYRLRISDPIPDFALQISPSAIVARPGMTVPITITALRKDGFAGDISLALDGTGIVLNGGRIPAGQDSIRATLTFPETTTASPAALAIEGRATVCGREVTRQAVPVDDMIQAFMYHHNVPARQFLVDVPGGTYRRRPVSLLTTQPMTLKVGGTGQIVYSIAGRTPFSVAETRLQLSDPPDGITIQSITPAPNGAAVTFKADSVKVKPGLKGNLIVEAFGSHTPAPVNGKSLPKVTWSMGYLPAIPFQIAGP